MAPKYAKDQMLVAARSGTIVLEGKTYRLRKDETRVRAGHPLVKGREELFKPLEVSYDLEETSSAPGQVRTGAAKEEKKDG